MINTHQFLIYYIKLPHWVIQLNPTYCIQPLDLGIIFDLYSMKNAFQMRTNKLTTGSVVLKMENFNFFTLQLRVLCLETNNTCCVRKNYTIFTFLFIAEKVNKAQQQHSNGQKHNFPVCCVRRFLNGIIPWSGVKLWSFER